MENSNAKAQEDRLYRLQEELQITKTCFQLQMEENHSTQRLLQESLQRLSQERDDLGKMVKTQKEEAGVLYSEVLELEKRNEESLLGLRQLRRERDGLLEEKRERERRFEMMMEDSASILSSVLVVQTDLEERLERKMRDTQMFSERALSMLKDAERIMRRWGEDGGDYEDEKKGGGEEGEGRSEGDEMIRPFAEELEAIKSVFRNKIEQKRKREMLEGMFGEDKGKKVCIYLDRNSDLSSLSLRKRSRRRRRSEMNSSLFMLKL